MFSDSMGIVEDAILLGAPVTGDSKKWEEFGGVVAGRLVNGYCKYVSHSLSCQCGLPVVVVLPGLWQLYVLIYIC